MERPRRALLEEPEDTASPQPRRSGGFGPEGVAEVTGRRLDRYDDDTVIRPLRPARAARAAEPDDADEPDADEGEDEDEDADGAAEDETASPRPRRALAPPPEDPAEEAEPPRGRRALIEAPATPDSEPAGVSPGRRPARAWTESPEAPLAIPELPEVPAPTPSSTVGPTPAEGRTPSPDLRPASPPSPALVPTSAPAVDPASPAPASQPVLPPPRPTTPGTPPFRPAALPTPAVRSAGPGPGRGVGTPHRSRRRRSVLPIVIDRLLKSYDGQLAVRNLSFSVEPGRVTAFLGPNGAGKTTTLRILVGLVAPNTGTATFGSTPYARLERPAQTVGAVLDANTHPARTGRNHLRVLAPTAGATDQRVDELLELLGLTAVARRPTGDYSLGMRQRLALAAALLGDPDYLILDEPANGLDAEGVRWLRGFLRDFASSGRTVLLSSHLLPEVQATADEIVVINQGRLLAQMPLSELNLGRGVVRARVSDEPRAAQALAHLDAEVEHSRDEVGPFLRVHTPEVASVGAALFGAGIAVYELSTERRDLETEFIDMLEASR